MKKNLTFVSKDNQKVKLEIETRPARASRDWDTLETVENPVELSICGECGSGGGQINGEFVPTEAQSKLVEFWKKYHLNTLCSGTKKQMEALEKFESRDYKKQCEYLKSIGFYEDRGYKYGTGWLCKPFPEDELEAAIKAIEEEEAARVAGLVEIDLDNEEEAIEAIRERTDLNPNHVLVILRTLGLSVSETDNIELVYGKNMYCVYGTDYLVGTEDELRSIANGQLERYMWVEAVEGGYTDASYEDWKEDVLSEDLGGLLNHWDGTIEDEKVGGVWYSICRS